MCLCVHAYVCEVIRGFERARVRAFFFVFLFMCVPLGMRMCAGIPSLPCVACVPVRALCACVCGMQVRGTHSRSRRCCNHRVLSYKHFLSAPHSLITFRSVQGHSVSLRFRGTEQCTFDREETRELEVREGAQRYP